MRLTRPDAFQTIMVSLVLLGIGSIAIAEELSFLGYHPAPRGLYAELRAERSFLAIESGAVSIGLPSDTAAQAKLHIRQDEATSPALSIVSDDGLGNSRAFFVDQQGNVGVNIPVEGFTGLSESLEVDGDVRLSGLTGGNDVAVLVDAQGKLYHDTSETKTPMAVELHQCWADSPTWVAADISCQIDCPADFYVFGCTASGADYGWVQPVGVTSCLTGALQATTHRGDALCVELK